MNETHNTPSSDSNEELIPTLSLTLGQKLKAAREEKGLSAGDVAGHLKLSVRQVEALENNAFERLPNAVFIRGFMRSYAKFLKMDEKNIIQELDKILPLSHNNPIEEITEENQPNISLNNQTSSQPSGNNKGMFFAIIAILLMATGISGYFLFAGKNTSSEHKQDHYITNTAATFSETEIETESSATPTIATTSATISSEESSASTEQANTDKLVIHNRHKTYMTVVNGKGDVLLNSKLIPAKTIQEFPVAAAPYKIRIGYAIDASITFKGQLVNLTDKIKRKTLEITIPETNNLDNVSDITTP